MFRHRAGSRLVAAAFAVATLATLAAVAAVAGPAAAAPPTVGTLTQLAGLPGCLSNDGFSLPGMPTSPACTDVRGLAAASSVAVSADGRNLYVSTRTTVGTVAVFTRDLMTGALTQLPGPAGCLSDNGTATGDSPTPVGCIDVHGLNAPFGVVITPNGRFVYAAGSREIAAFSRDPATGALTQLPGKAGCLSDDGTASGDPGAIGCVDGRGMGGTYGMTISADGNTLYVASVSLGIATPGSLVVLHVDPATGALSQPHGAADCFTDDGSTAAGDTCTDGRGLQGAAGVALSSTGKFLYLGATAGGGHATVSVYTVAAGGDLTPVGGIGGCYSDTGVTTGDASPTACTDVRALADPFFVAVSADDRNLYAASYGSPEVAVFARDPNTGALSQLGGNSGCISNDGTATGDAVPPIGCINGRALNGAFPTLVGPDGGDVYVGGYNGNELAVMNRDPVSGALSQSATPAGCFSQTGLASGDEPPASGCQVGRLFGAATSLALAPQGQQLYMTASSGNGIAVYDREVAPVCTPASATTTTGHGVTVALSCSDANGEVVTVRPVSQPANGTLGAIDTTGHVTYTPRRGFTGVDQFSFDATDGTNSAAAAVATITVVPHATLTRIAGGRIKLAHKSARLKLTCSHGAGKCAGTLRITRTVTTRKHGKRHKHTSTLAKQHYSIRAGATSTVAVKLKRSVRTLIGDAGHKGLAAHATATPAKGTGPKRSATIALTA